ncbi:sulfurtransferase/chromate resistance protein [Yoonia sp. SS1-5]|uniref:Sulfurtransferase/chromate resistance protein n=1 Tax=Yoonia rhodophyticola TaxID=3137370 RepID=A0AAN0MBK7_9RHOB
MAAFTEISPSNLMRLIGTPQCPILVDVCIDDDHDDDPYLIPTAFRHAHHDPAGLTARVAGREVVVICQKGAKLSHGVAASLRANGVNAQVLSGGNHGWRDAKLPRVPAAAIPGNQWVTRHRPKIDRIACPWLIRRFVDPGATFLFVPPAEVTAVAERFNATPFDIEDTFWSHRGDACTFDTMIAEFGLSHPALDALATVVRAADTNRHDQSPQAAGLLALSVGLSRMYKDDNAQLAAGMGLYDALYRWARDGQSESHDWPADRRV